MGINNSDILKTTERGFVSKSSEIACLAHLNSYFICLRRL